MRRSRHDIFSLLCEEFTDYYVDKYVATEPSENMTCKDPFLKVMIRKNNLKVIPSFKVPHLLLDISIEVMPELVFAFFTSFVA